MKIFFALVVSMIVGGMLVHFTKNEKTQEVIDEETHEAVEVASAKAHDAVDLGWKVAQEKYYEACRTRYLTKTSCFQHRKVAECLARIEKKCGSPEEPDVADDVK